MTEQVSNGQQSFFDINGDPLSSGKVFFYVPGTTTPKTTWVDEGLTVANTNPILLDQAGRATIWGNGDYRQIVQDQFGSVQWDQIVAAGIGSTVNGDLNVNGNAVINGSTTVNGNEAINGNTTVSGDETVGGNETVGGVATFNGGEVVNGSTILNGGLQVNNTDELGGPSDIKGGLVVEAGVGQTVALEVLGAIAAPPGTGGLNVNNGLIVNADAGQVTALKVTAGEEVDGPLLLNGTLTTELDATFVNNVSIGGNLTVGGTINGHPAVAMNTVLERMDELLVRVQVLEEALVSETGR